MKPSKYSQAIFVLICITIGGCGLGLAGCVPLEAAFSYMILPPAIINHILQEADGLTQIWSRNGTYLLPGYRTMDASTGKICFFGDLRENTLKRNMICLDSLTGTVL